MKPCLQLRLRQAPPLPAPPAPVGRGWRGGLWPILLLCAGLSCVPSAAATCSTRQVITGKYAPIPFAHVALQNPRLQPPGSVIASVVVPALAIGLSADTALWECGPEDLPKLYFLAATNGTGRSNDLYPLETTGNTAGHIYPTMFRHIGLQLSMNGTLISHTWTRVPLPKIQPDKDGRVYIRVEHIPQLHAQLYPVLWDMDRKHSSNCGKSTYPTANKNGYDCEEPQLHIQLAGVPGLSYDEENSDSNSAANQRARNNHNGFGYRMFRAMSVSTTPSCALRSLTPQVIFPVLSVRDLERGKSVSARISVQLECDKGSKNDMPLDRQTMISLQASANAYRTARKLDLLTPGGGARYLVSDRYEHDPLFAHGVGISLYSGQQRRYFSEPGDHEHRFAPDSGWVPFSQGATCTPPMPPNDQDIDPYGNLTCQLEWTVRLEKLPEQVVTPGKIDAVARLKIKVP